MKKIRRLFVFSVLISAFGLRAQSDSSGVKADIFILSLEELMNVKVSTASKREERINETPNVMHVITQQQIKSRGYRNLRDVLSDIPGFNVLHRDLQYVSQVRGIAPNENEKVSLMLNGVIISQVTEDNYLTNLINLDNVQNIEIIIGPGSVLYGSKSLCAIINIITKNSDDTEITAGVGNYNYKSLTVSKGKHITNDKNIFVSATRVQNSGWNAWRNTSDEFNNLKGTMYTGELYPSYFLFAKAKLNNWDMQFSSLNSSMPELYIHNSSPDVSGNRDDEHDNLLIRNKKEWSGEFSTIFQGVYTNKRMLRAVSANDTVRGVQTSFDLSQKEYAIDLSMQYKLEKHYFQAGLQGNYNFNRHNYMFDWRPDNPSDTTSYMQSLVDIKDTYSYGAYISDNYEPGEKVIITAACRADRNTILNTDKIYLSPRIAFIYMPVKKITLKLLYNTATRMPAPWMSPLNELWNVNKYNNSVLNSWLANPTAEKPERLTAYEFQTIYHSKRTILTFNAYYQTLNDFIAWFSPFTNTGNFSGVGCEMNVMSEIAPSIKAWGNATYTNASFTNKTQSTDVLGAGKTIANEKGEMMSVPSITSNVGLDLSFKNFHLSPRIKYLHRTPAFDAVSNSYIYLQDRVYLNATFSVTGFLYKNLTLQFIGRNLTDNTKTLPMQFQKLTYNAQGVNFEVAASLAF